MRFGRAGFEAAYAAPDLSFERLKGRKVPVKNSLQGNWAVGIFARGRIPLKNPRIRTDSRPPMRSPDSE
jgi:hypothetical protein